MNPTIAMNIHRACKAWLSWE